MFSNGFRTSGGNRYYCVGSGDEFFCVEYKDIFKDSINSEISETYNILRNKQPEYFNYYAIENPNDADPYLITYAYHYDLCIVTQDEFQSTANRYLNIN